MMASTKLRSTARVAIASVAVVVSLSACSDSSGPTKLDSSAALQSLALGMGALVTIQAPGVGPMGVTSFDEIAPLLDQINVGIDGSSQTMFALSMRETFPAGTCVENIFIDPAFPPPPGQCTSPQLGLGVLLWQSHSASAPPDRMIFVLADAGTIGFDFGSNLYEIGTNPPPLQGVAIYVENVGDLENFTDIWFSMSGTLTSQIAATGQSCGLPLPPYAKSGSCSIATFDEQGTITFAEFSETGPTTSRRVVTIPRQTIHGLWQSITETQPVDLSSPWDYNRVSGLRLNRSGAALSLFGHKFR
jgi:hypothetical protein